MKHGNARELDNPMRVVIADDFELMRVGLRAVLEAEPDLTVVGVAADGREAVDLCGRLRPDLVLLDERMPVMDGVEAARLIKQRDQAIRVITLSPQGDLIDRLRALKAGVDGCVLKNVSRGELIIAVREVLQGQFLFSGPDEATLLNQVYGAVPGERSLAVEQLTPRELDVLRLLAQGKTNAEIAYDLSLSRGTVKAYVEQIIAKLQVSGRTHAAVRAVELGLVRTTDE